MNIDKHSNEETIFKIRKERIDNMIGDLNLKNKDEQKRIKDHEDINKSKRNKKKGKQVNKNNKKKK